MKRKALLVGVGLDGRKGEHRITRGENFWLYGGSERTHTHLQEKAISFNEVLDKRRKKLEDISHEEFDDIAHEIGLRKLS